jgi:hypothetical protein
MNGVVPRLKEYLRYYYSSILSSFPLAPPPSPCSLLSEYQNVFVKVVGAITTTPPWSPNSKNVGLDNLVREREDRGNGRGIEGNGRGIEG